MARQRIVAVVGARALPDEWAPQVAAVVRHFLGRGWGIGSGGARGADAYALRAVVGAGTAACRRSVVYLPGRRPALGDGALGAFAAQGGRVVEGPGVDREALLARSRRLAREAAGVVAFLWGPSRGSVYTLRAAVRAGTRVAVVIAGGGTALPAFPDGRWVRARSAMSRPSGGSRPRGCRPVRPGALASPGSSRCQTASRSTRCSPTSRS